MFLQSRGLNSGGSPLLVYCPHPPSPTNVTGASRVPVLCLESAKVKALQEVDKMLEKRTLELVDHPGLGYYC